MRRLAALLLAAAAVAGCTLPAVPHPAPAPPTRAQMAAEARTQWGVNTHVGAPDYRNRIPQVQADLHALHVVWVRDDSPHAPAILGPAFRVQYVLATSDCREAIRAVGVALDGGAAAIELRNEPDYGGTHDQAEVERTRTTNAAVIAYVQHRSPHTLIVGTAFGLPRPAWAPILGRPASTYGNLHIYRGGTVDPAGWKAWRQRYYAANLPRGGPWMVTETGTHDCFDCHTGHVPTTNAVAGSRIVSDFEALRADGASRVFQYELLDEASRAGMQAHFGLVEADGRTFKPQAIRMAAFLAG